MLPNRFVVGAEADATFPSTQNFNRISIGGIALISSPFGQETYSETMLSSGTLRGRVGYAPNFAGPSWLIYATGGFAWSYDRLTLTNAATGTTDMPFLWRLGWTAGAGVEVPVASWKVPMRPRLRNPVTAILPG
jgi:high affinity Mn2+ porin